MICKIYLNKVVFQNGQRTWTLHQRRQRTRQEGHEKVLIFISHHYSETHSRSLEGLESNTLRAPKTGEIVERLQLLLVGGDVTLREHFGELLAVAHEALSQEKRKHMFPKRLHLNDTTAVFIAQTWSHSKYPSTEEWINNFWYIHAVK